jgi:hypothetical protein
MLVNGERPGKLLYHSDSHLGRVEGGRRANDMAVSRITACIPQSSINQHFEAKHSSRLECILDRPEAIHGVQIM